MMAQNGKAVKITAEQQKGETMQELLKRLKGETKPAEEKGK